MRKVVTVEYDAVHQSLRLVEPLDGVEDRHQFQATLEEPGPDAAPPWLKFEGILSKEDGQDLSRVIDEMFPPWNEDE